MAYLIGSADTTRFSSTYAINSGASGLGLWLVGNPTDTAAVATGTAQTLWVYISSWGTQTNAKFCLYDESSAGALLESVIITSAAGTGLISVPLAGTSSITSGNNYRLGLYTEDIDDLTMFSDGAALTLRFFSSSGSYTTPADPSNQSGGFDSSNEFYFAIDDSTGGASIDTIDNPILDAETGNAATYTAFPTANINSTTVDGIAGSGVVDDAAGNVTWTNPSIMAIALAGGGAIPDFGTVAVEFTNGTETGSANTTFSEAAGFSTVTLAAIDTVSADYLYQLLLGVGITIANGEEIYYNNQSGQFTITADGGIVSTVSTSTLTNIKAGPVVTDMVTWTNGSVVTSTNNSIFKSIYGSIYK